MNDLLGLGKGTDKLISAVERALGAIYRPYGIRRDADAEAHRLVMLENAKTDAKCRNTVELARAKAKAEAIVATEKQALEARLKARLQYEALRQQQNIDNIVAGALTGPEIESNASDVDEDWLTGFFERAKTVSSAEMQALWSRVLALEVGSPGMFSPRSLDVLRKMSRREAMAFQTACQLAASLGANRTRSTILHGAHRSRWLSFKEAPEIKLEEVGLPYLTRVNLAHTGLMYEKGLVLGPFDRGEEVTIFFATTQLKLRAKRGGVKIENYSFTPVGSELSALVPSEENPANVDAVRKSLSKFFHVSDVSS